MRDVMREMRDEMRESSVQRLYSFLKKPQSHQDLLAGISTSLQKLNAIQALCDELGVIHKPMVNRGWKNQFCACHKLQLSLSPSLPPQMLPDNTFVAPLLSWYHYSWDTAPDVDITAQKWKDEDYIPNE